MRIVAVGISRFRRSEIRPLPFAASDARAFAAAMEPANETRVLTDQDATVANLRAALAWLADSGPETPVVLFLVSHVSRHAGLLCLELDDESIALRDVIHLLTERREQSARLLLDLFRGGVSDAPVTVEELSAIVSAQTGSVLLLSDDGTNGSHVSGELQAGVWARHITEAFSGVAGSSRNEDGELTVSSLRRYLSQEIPRSLSRAFAEPKSQSPLIVGGSDDDLLAGPNPQPTEAMSPKLPFADIRLFSEQTVPVKSLGGFRKSVHTVPSDTLASSREWVARLAEPDLAKELEEALKRLRRSFGYKRKDMRADGPSGGGASILTPDFSYHLSVQQHAERSDRAVFRRTLGEIKNIDRLAGAECEAAFPQGFTALFQPFQMPGNIEQLIDVLEDDPPRAISEIDYPTDLSYCDLRIAGFEGRVRIEPGGITITAASPTSPASLAAQYAFVKRLLG